MSKDNAVVNIKLKSIESGELPKIHASEDWNYPSSRRLLLLVEGEYCFGYYIKWMVMGKEKFGWMIENRSGNWKITHWAYLPTNRKIKKGKEDPKMKKIKLQGIPTEFQIQFAKDEASGKEPRRKSSKKRKPRKSQL